MGKNLWRILGILAGAGLAAACGGEQAAGAANGLVIPLSDQFSSDFALLDQDGRAVADETFRGRPMIVYFGFATCPEVCPLALARLSAALNELSARDQAKIAPVFITVDPERDTPEKLKAFLEFDPRIAGLTGSAEAAAAARRSFKVSARRQELPESALGYTINHSSFFYIVDPEGRPRAALNDSLTAQELATVLRRSIKGRY